MTMDEAMKRTHWLASRKRERWNVQMPKMCEAELSEYRKTFPGDMFTDDMLRAAWDGLVVSAKP